MANILHRGCRHCTAPLWAPPGNRGWDILWGHIGASYGIYAILQYPAQVPRHRTPHPHPTLGATGRSSRQHPPCLCTPSMLEVGDTERELPSRCNLCVNYPEVSTCSERRKPAKAAKFLSSRDVLGLGQVSVDSLASSGTWLSSHLALGCSHCFFFLGPTGPDHALTTVTLEEHRAESFVILLQHIRTETHKHNARSSSLQVGCLGPPVRVVLARRRRTGTRGNSWGRARRRRSMWPLGVFTGLLFPGSTGARSSIYNSHIRRTHARFEQFMILLQCVRAETHKQIGQELKASKLGPCPPSPSRPR